MSFFKSKPFGEVCGIGIPYKYEQGGKYFDQNLNEVTEQGVPVPGGEYIKPEDEIPEDGRIMTESASKAAIDDVYTNSLSVDQGAPVPEVTLEETSSEDANVDNLDDLKLPEIKEQLDRLGVSYDKQARKPDLKALLRYELAADEIAAGQDEDTE